MKYIIPENITEKWINRRKPKEQIPGYQYERLIYAIHCIAKNLNLGNECTMEGIPTVRLHSKFLKKKIGCHYNKYFEFLEKKKVITVSTSYQTNIESKKYAFTMPFIVEMKIVDFPESNGQLIKKQKSNRDELTTSITKNPAKSFSNIMDEIIDYDGLIGELESVNESEIEEFCQWMKTYPVLDDWNKWYNDKLVLDIEGAKIAVEAVREKVRLYPQYKKVVIEYFDKKTGKKRKTFKSVKIKPETIHSCASSQIANFQVKDFKPVHRDKTIGRLYSTMVQTPKVLRPFLTYDGEPLGYLDIKNCQPFLITGLLNPSFWKTDIPYLVKEYNKFTFFPEKCISSIQKIGYAEYLFPNNQKGRKRYRMVLTAIKELQGKDDAYFFKESVTQGNFYKDMENRILENKDYIVVTKEFVKESMFTVLFTANQYIGAPDAAPKRKFREIYPHVYELLAAIKSGKGNKSLLSRLLQRLESHIMIDGVATHLTQHYPDIPFYSIHDAVACPVKYMEVVERVIQNEVKLATGWAPSLHKELWIPDGCQNLNLNQAIPAIPIAMLNNKETLYKEAV